tara:strand:+ start:909 stop:1349 length:441 start_codon:yes stop_codon:yes gene_type:complete
MTKKPATIFDFMNGMTHQKKEWSKYTDLDQKKFAPFIVNRWLSMRMELIEVINQLQKYTIGLLSPRDTYRLYHGLLPAQRTFAKYIKGKKEDKYDTQLVSQIADHYLVSKMEAIDYIELMSKDSCSTLLSLYGYTEKEIKKMLKGK